MPQISEPEPLELSFPELRPNEAADIKAMKISWDYNIIEGWQVETTFYHEAFIAPDRLSKISYIWFPGLASVSAWLGKLTAAETGSFEWNQTKEDLLRAKVQKKYRFKLPY